MSFQIFYLIISFFLVILFAKQLKVFQEKFTYGFLNSVYIIYAYIFFPLAVILLDFKHRSFLNVSYGNNSYYLSSLTLVIILLLALNIGVYINSLIKSSFLFENLFNFNFIIDKRPLFLLYFVYTMIRIGLFIFITKEVNPMKIIANRSHFDHYFLQYNLAYILYPLLGISVFLFIYFAADLLKRKKITSSIFLLIFQLYSTSLYGSRGSLLMTILYFIIAFHFYYKRVKWQYIIIFLLLSSIVIVSVGLIRNTGKEEIELGGEMLLWQMVYRSDYLSGYTKLIEEIDSGKLQYQYGQTFWNFFSSFFPRAIIPEKPSSVEVQLTRKMFGGSRWVLAFGGIGEMFYNFSYIGVLCWFTFVGFMLSEFNKLLLKSIKNNNLILFSMVLSLPFFLNGWNTGIDVSQTRFFIISYVFVIANMLILYMIQKTVLIFKSNNN